MIKQLILDYCASSYCSIAVRNKLYKLLGLNTYYVHSYKGLTFADSNLNNITIGSNCFINEYCYFENNACITIHNNVAIAMHCKFITTTHAMENNVKRARAAICLPITICDGVWIGANSVVLPGVVINAGCVIAAGSVVHRDCEANYLYGGVPVRKIRKLNCD